MNFNQSLRERSEWIILGVLLLFQAMPVVVQGQTLSAVTPTVSQGSGADELYHQALEDYLDGNYDQSILYAAQSLQKDPSYAKSKNLLTVLTSEKEKASKTVIWLPSATAEPSPAPAAAPVVSAPPPDTTGIQKNVDGIQTKLDRFMGAQARKDQEVNGQLHVIQELVRSHQDGQYEELKKSQVEVANRLQKVEASQGPDLRLLYALCGVSILFSAAAALRKPNRPKRS